MEYKFELGSNKYGELETHIFDVEFDDIIEVMQEWFEELHTIEYDGDEHEVQADYIWVSNLDGDILFRVQRNG